MTTPTTVELIFERGDASAEEIADAVADILADSDQADGDLAKRAAEAGLDPAQLPELRITVREGAQGLEPILTSIIIGIAARAGSSVAEAFWTKVIWPQVRRRLGARSLLSRTAKSVDKPQNASTPNAVLENPEGAGP
jgi:hypothetical protein